MNEDILEEAGLSKNEAKAYIALLELGEASGGEIADKSKLHRTNAYDAIERLVEKGLVAYLVKNKIKYFRPADPENLLRLIREKENKIQAIIPQLKLAKQLTSKGDDVSIQTGITAIFNTLYDFLDGQSPIDVFGIPKNIVEVIKGKISYFHEERIKKHILMRHIYNHSAQDRIVYLNTLPYTEARYLPAKFDSQVATFICGDVVVLFVCTEPYTSIKIHNQELANAYKRYFELLYTAAKR